MIYLSIEKHPEVKLTSTYHTKSKTSILNLNVGRFGKRFICGSNWTYENAKVACRMLGLR